MTTPKSPEQIMEEIYKYAKSTEHEVNCMAGDAGSWCCLDKEHKQNPTFERLLRSSMASLLCYMAERMKLPCNDEVFYDKDGNGFSNPRTLLIEEARKINNE